MKHKTKAERKTNEGNTGPEGLSSDKKTVVEILQLVDITRKIFDMCLLSHIRTKLGHDESHGFFVWGLINKTHYRMLCPDSTPICMTSPHYTSVYFSSDLLSF